MNNFLILIGGFVILLLVYLQSSRKKESPTLLDMKKKQTPPESDAAASTGQVLTIMFNFNGHSFEAYETLGLPAGSSWDEVKQAFDRSLDGADPSAREFYLSAFNAIKARQSF